jgi:4-amino-4-deoxy-L-arabinose transferase-like glycosyltransferase
MVTPPARHRLIRLTAGFLACMALVCTLRAPAFFWSVVNIDESIYLMIARSMLDGNVLYCDIWDRKQPLTFGLFALSQLVFGESILAIRLLGCIAVAISCLLLYRIARTTFGPERVGPMAAAATYALFSLSSGGLATNTEILFAPFAIGAVALMIGWWVAATGSPSMRRSAGAGLLLGLGTFIKLIVVFDALFVSLLLVAGWWRDRGSLGTGLRWLATRLAALAAGAATPWIIGAVTFALLGAWHEFIFSNFTFNMGNISDRAFTVPVLWLTAQRLMTESGLLWLGFAAGTALAVSRPRWISAADRRLLAALLTWAVLATAAAVSLRSPILHYYLQPVPALSLITALVFSRLWSRGARLPGAVRVGLVVLLLVPQIRLVAERWRHVIELEDVPATVAEYVQQRVAPGDYIYVANYQPVIYLLTETRSPTRWAFPQFLVLSSFRERLGTDLEQEMASLFAHRPRYVIVDTNKGILVDPAYYRVLHERYLDVDYELETHISSLALFRRIEARGGDTGAAAATDESGG